MLDFTKEQLPKIFVSYIKLPTSLVPEEITRINKYLELTWSKILKRVDNEAVICDNINPLNCSSFYHWGIVPPLWSDVIFSSNSNTLIGAKVITNTANPDSDKLVKYTIHKCGSGWICILPDVKNKNWYKIYDWYVMKLHSYPTSYMSNIVKMSSVNFDIKKRLRTNAHSNYNVFNLFGNKNIINFWMVAMQSYSEGGRYNLILNEWWVYKDIFWMVMRKTDVILAQPNSNINTSDLCWAITLSEVTLSEPIYMDLLTWNILTKIATVDNKTIYAIEHNNKKIKVDNNEIQYRIKTIDNDSELYSIIIKDLITSNSKICKGDTKIVNICDIVVESTV